MTKMQCPVPIDQRRIHKFEEYDINRDCGIGMKPAQMMIRNQVQRTMKMEQRRRKKTERIEESECDWDELLKEEEETGSGSFTFDSGCWFRKLDEFDACEQLQNDESRSAGIEFIDEKIKKEQWIAVNVIDEYLINKCKKNCRQRITIKLKALLRSGALDKRQGSIDSSHSSVVLFNMNHSVYAYLAE
eukprot:982114_1